MPEYMEVLRAEVKVDCYGGPECDQHSKYWNAYAAGDMQDDSSVEDLRIDLKHYPPGTKVIVTEPLCPDCGLTHIDCSSDEDCDFDWKNWAEEQYS